MRHVLHYEQMNMDYIHMRYHHQAKNHKPNTEIKEMTGCFSRISISREILCVFSFLVSHWKYDRLRILIFPYPVTSILYQLTHTHRHTDTIYSQNLDYPNSCPKLNAYYSFIRSIEMLCVACSFCFSIFVCVIPIPVNAISLDAFDQLSHIESRNRHLHKTPPDIAWSMAVNHDGGGGRMPWCGRAARLHMVGIGHIRSTTE